MEDFSLLYWPGDTTESLGQTPIFGDALLVTWSVKKGCIIFEAIAVLRGLYHPGEGKEPLLFYFLVCDEEAYDLFFKRNFSHGCEKSARGQTHEALGRFRIVRARSPAPRLGLQNTWVLQAFFTSLGNKLLRCTGIPHHCIAGNLGKSCPYAFVPLRLVQEYQPHTAVQP